MINCLCIDPEGYILGSCNSEGYFLFFSFYFRNIDIYNVYTHEATRVMNHDRTVNNVCFYRQGKKYFSFLVFNS